MLSRMSNDNLQYSSHSFLSIVIMELYSVEPVRNILEDHSCDALSSFPQHIRIDGWDPWKSVRHLNFHVGVK